LARFALSFFAAAKNVERAAAALAESASHEPVLSSREPMRSRSPASAVPRASGATLCRRATARIFASRSSTHVSRAGSASIRSR